MSLHWLASPSSAILAVLGRAGSGPGRCTSVVNGLMVGAECSITGSTLSEITTERDS